MKFANRSFLGRISAVFIEISHCLGWNWAALPWISSWANPSELLAQRASLPSWHKGSAGDLLWYSSLEVGIVQRRCPVCHEVFPAARTWQGSSNPKTASFNCLSVFLGRAESFLLAINTSPLPSSQGNQCRESGY